MSNLGLIERARKLLNAASHGSAGQRPARQYNTEKKDATAPSQTTKRSPKPIWMETEASVTDCTREFVQTRAFRSRRGNEPKKFVVSFTYYAHARTYYDRFTSAEAKGQGECFSVFYNAFDPKENVKSVPDSENRSPLSAIGIAGYVLVSALFLMMTHG